MPTTPWLNYNHRRGKFVHSLVNAGYQAYKLGEVGKQLTPILNPIKISAYQAASRRDKYTGMAPYPKRLRNGNFKRNSIVVPVSARARLPFKNVFTKKKTVVKAKARGGRWTGHGGGLGKFNKPSRRGATKDTEYLRLGAHTSYEVANTITDAECVYIGHSTLPLEKTGMTVAMSLARKLFMEAGICIDSPDGPITGTAVLEVRMDCKNTITGAFSNIVAYNPAVTFSLLDVATSIHNALSGLYGTGNPDIVPLYLLLRQSATPFTPLAQIDLMQLKLNIKVKAAMKIQNRTSTSVGDEADDVDNQPLQGKLYEINNPQPIFQTRDTIAFPMSSNTGIVAVVAGSANGLRDPPHPRTLGAAKASTVRILPGELKYSTVSSEVQCSLDWFYKHYTAQGGGGVARSRLGKSRIFAFEKMIDVGTNSILCAYEAEWDIKAMCKYKPRTCIRKYNFTA